MCVHESLAKKEHVKRILSEVIFLSEVAQSDAEAQNLESSRRTLEKLREKVTDAIKTLAEITIKH